MGNSAGVPVAGNGARDAVADGHLLAWRATFLSGSGSRALHGSQKV
jgi:mevalonate pyrophosphate decarboxylase